MSTENKGYRKLVFLICIVAALGGLLFGLDQGFIANAGETLNFIYGVEKGSAIEGNFNSILAIGGIIGTICAGFFTRILGRKNTLLIAGFSFVIGSVISSLLPPYSILTACRFILGFGVGLASFATPLYLAETAPTNIRGSILTLFQIMITFGIFLICLSNVLIIELVGKTKISITLMFSVLAFFALLMFIGCFFLPKSPRWLMLKGKENDAIKVLEKIRNADEVHIEIEEIKQKINQQRYSLIEAFKYSFFWKIVAAGVMLQMLQQLIGINAIIYYSPQFLQSAGLSIVLAGLSVFFINFISTFPAIKWVEKWGRKKLLVVGAIIMMFSLLTIALSFILIDIVHIKSHFIKYILLIACLIYIFGFACSWGPVVWTLCSEIFPQKIREIGLTITTITNWTFAGVVIANSNRVMNSGEWGKPIIFIFYAIVCLIAILLLKKFVPETKGVSLEKIESDLISGKRLIDIGK
ncbi:MAG: sugar porter family MFS transporter [Francisella sp.]